MAGSPQSGLQHCPGLHGPGVSTGVHRRGLGELLSPSAGGRAAAVELPVFQRKYCWGPEQLRGWWADLLGRGKGSAACRAPDGTHSIGKIVFIETARRCDGADDAAGEPDDGGGGGRDNANKEARRTPRPPATTGRDGRRAIVTCIDGQQRLTTAMILLSTLRDLAQRLVSQAGPDATREDHSVLGAVRGRVDGAVYVHDDVDDDDDVHDDGTATTHVVPRAGVTPREFRLVPTWDDRESFTAVIAGARLVHEGSIREETMRRPAIAGSAQLAASRVFLELAEEELRSRELSSLTIQLLFLRSIVAKQLEGTSYVHISVCDESNAQQMFLWLQENAIMGAMLVYNPVPGVGLSAVDLIRNHLLSYYLNDRERQERVYLDKWLPMERALASFSGVEESRRAQQQRAAFSFLKVAEEPSASEAALAAYLHHHGGAPQSESGPRSPAIPRSITVYRSFTAHLQEQVLRGREGDRAQQDAVERLMDDIRHFAADGETHI